MFTVEVSVRLADIVNKSRSNQPSTLRLSASNGEVFIKGGK